MKIRVQQRGHPCDGPWWWGNTRDGTCNATCNATCNDTCTLTGRLPSPLWDGGLSGVAQMAMPLTQQPLAPTDRRSNIPRCNFQTSLHLLSHPPNSRLNCQRGASQASHGKQPARRYVLHDINHGRMILGPKFGFNKSRHK
ncbi:hypothetical protein FH972_024103 [Carpinus fangiana]|uniref:Uncharacterized protein n=1 Tax=Carpinus fangiana TaxID=176857 RepID=A0A5N6KX32_9ROSI|nr:hypothetical protein FH972_024103 [Carpinus fangiana]